MTVGFLVINSGSSSIKFQVLTSLEAEASPLAVGLVEQIGEFDGRITVRVHREGEEIQEIEREDAVEDHTAGLTAAIALLGELGVDLEESALRAVGHRVVHGGASYSDPVLIDDQVESEIDRLSTLAPLHNPAHLEGIRVARKLFPDVPHVAVFDTAFFHRLPLPAATYAIDRDLAREYKIRRYGFHGTSHEYVAHATAELLGRPLESLRQIILHLGNGASASAVDGGRAVETSMGFTPLEGLVMGTRSGDLDAGILFYLNRLAGLGVDELDRLVNRNSGLRGLSGENDFRALHTLIKAGDEDARLAFEVFVHRVRKYVGAYLAVLGGADTIVFTAGVGENDPEVRLQALGGLEELGIEIDEALNAVRTKAPRVISTPASRVTILVVPTNEELAIARAAERLL